jgi:hypothetical protein
VIAMQQYLLSKEVYKKLVAKTNPEANKMKEVAKYIIKDIVYRDKVEGANQIFISQLENCVRYLRSKGIYVYFKYREGSYNCFYVTFVAGEAGRVLEKLDNQFYYLCKLEWFAIKYKDILPKPLTHERRNLSDYLNKIYVMTHIYLIPAYLGDDKECLIQACGDGWKLVDRIDAYLESIADLRRAHAVVTML